MFSIKAENDSFCSLEIRQLGHLKVLNNTANYKNISPKDDLQTATASTNAFSLYGEPDKKPTGWKGTSFQISTVVYTYGLSHTINGQFELKSPLTFPFHTVWVALTSSTSCGAY